MDIKKFASKVNDVDDGVLRTFGTGATRDTADGKLDPEGFTHPMVLKQFYKYMNMNRLQSDGTLRASDNWQKGIPRDAYIKSLKRHVDDAWLEHRGFSTDSGIIAALCGAMFNSMGMLLEVLKDRGMILQDFDGDEPTPELKERQEVVARNSQSIFTPKSSFRDCECVGDGCGDCTQVDSGGDDA